MARIPTAQLRENNVRDAILVGCALLLTFLIYPIAGFVLKSEYYGIPTNRPAPAFELTDFRGNTVSNSDYRGKYTFLMFGYLRCADTCHSQVLIFDTIATLLAGESVHFLYLSMDRKHDSATALQAYFDSRGENFDSLRAGSQTYLQSLANRFEAGFRIQGDPDSPNFGIDHPARISLIDPRGNLRIVYRGVGLDPGKIAQDYFRLNKAALI